MSATYATDPRVVWSGEGWPPDAVALIPADPADADYNRSRLVLCARCGEYVVIGAVDEGLTLLDPGDPSGKRRQSFATAEEAIHALIGDPR